MEMIINVWHSFPLSAVLVWVLAIAGTVLVTGTLFHLFRIKKRWWVWPLLFLAGFLADNTVVYIGDWANMPLTFLVLLIIIWMCSEDSGWKKLSVGLLFGSTMFAWNAIVDNFIRVHAEGYLWPRVIFCIIFFLGTKYFGPDKMQDLEPKMWRLILFLTMVPVGNVLSTVLLSEERWVEGQLDLRLHFAVLCLSFVAFIGLLWAIRVLMHQRELEQEAMFSRMNQKYYETMEQQHFEIRRLRHDMANHLQTLSVLAPEQKEKYMKELLESGAITRTLNYCGDSTINAVLSVKENVLKQQHIVCEWKLDIPKELPFEKADICALYANALDNAIEACKMAAEKQRKITLESRAAKGVLVLKMTNTCCVLKPDYLLKKTGNLLPKTTKKDSKNHGYGLRSMEESVRKYGGSMEVHRDEDVFTFFCYLPFPSNLK